MSTTSLENLNQFLAISSGDGSGCCSGNGSDDGHGFGHGYSDGLGRGFSYCSGSGYINGSGSGYGHGSTNGCGDGYIGGYGSGDGSGSGSGSGLGISRFGGEPVYIIDGINTIITSVRGNIAKGYILMQDLTLIPCFIARAGDYFAHGDTIEQAVRDAQAKLLDNATDDERVDEFLVQFSPDHKHSGHDLFDGHRTLTGSCEAGRRAFVEDNKIDLSKLYTLQEFVEIVDGAYGDSSVQILKSRLLDK